MSGELQRLEGADRRASEHAARLHAVLLPDSPIARLGPVFMTHFYYGTLVRDNLLRCYLAYVGDSPAGFISFTDRPATFMAEGLRRHWLHLAGVLARAVVADPRRIGVMLWTFGLMRRRTRAPEPGEGELLSFGVLPEFRGVPFVQRTGRRIGAELFAAACDDLHALGADRFRAVVAKDNAAALMFYQAQGCRVDRERDSLAGTLVVVGRCGESDDVSVR